MDVDDPRAERARELQELARDGKDLCPKCDRPKRKEFGQCYTCNQAEQEDDSKWDDCPHCGLRKRTHFPTCWDCHNEMV